LVVLAIRTGDGRNAKISAFYQGAGQPVGFGLLEINQQLLRRPGRQFLIGTRGGGNQAGSRQHEQKDQRRQYAQR